MVTVLGCSATMPPAAVERASSPPPFAVVSPGDAFVRVRGVGNVICSGTLIAEDLVLTAHRCVTQRDERGRLLERDLTPESIRIEIGSGALSMGEVTVRAVVAPPCRDTSVSGALAILVLSRSLSGVPIQSFRTNASPRANDAIMFFGFGRCAHSSDPVHLSRRRGGVLSVQRGSFVAYTSICPGDTGGAVLNEAGDLVGVLSTDVAGDAPIARLSTFTRVDAWDTLFAAAHQVSRGATPGAIQPLDGCQAP
jgi:hypothetical protein